MKDLKTFEKTYHFKELEDWGAYMSNDAKQFAKDFTSSLSNELKELNCSCKLNTGHYYISGFIYSNDTQRYCYISFNIPRNETPVLLSDTTPSSLRNYKIDFLLGSAQNDKDFTGGRNQYASLTGIIPLAKRILGLGEE